VNTIPENSPIYIEEYNYSLPDDRIAKYPLTERDSSKLLIYKDGKISENVFANISGYLPENCLLVYNNTRVIQARLIFQKATGAHIEVFCLEPFNPVDYARSLSSNAECEWKCMVGNLKKWKEGLLTKTININGETFQFKAELLNSAENIHTVKFRWDNANITFAEILEKDGELPIPPYLHRKTEESDLTTYQTVYSKIKGSVAAPTAGLHFTPEVFESLKVKNIETDELTLHVGAGTFQPVKKQDIADHQMHREVISVHRNTIVHLQKKLGNIIAVGTTSVRTLESLYFIGIQTKQLESLSKDIKLTVPQWIPYQTNYEITVNQALQNILDYLDKNKLTTLHAETQIIIKPGYKFRIIDGIITNFHQPKSTLLLLVSAFVNGNWKTIYDYAIENDFRFLSYGDSSILLK
jgi:S-adenosylmethionine:tRNA ribosyltransferase-isomerase